MNVRPVRFALIGKTGSGKSEVARIFAEALNGQVVKTGVVCRQISKLLFGNEDKQSTQLLDDVLTSLDGSIFLKAALRGIDLSRPTILDSLRFKTDFQLATELGFRMIRVGASEELRRQRLLSRQQDFDFSRQGAHRSEVELDNVPVSFTITNNGSREQLRAAVLELVAPIE